MATAAELRGEAQELREKLQYITNRVALAEMRAMIDELEPLARAIGNSDATFQTAAESARLVPTQPPTCQAGSGHRAQETIGCNLAASAIPTGKSLPGVAAALPPPITGDPRPRLSLSRKSGDSIRER